MSQVWRWSKAAVKAFNAAAFRGQGRFHIPAGLDAALIEDLPLMWPAMVGAWAADASRDPRNLTLRVPASAVVENEDGTVSVRGPITRELLLGLLGIEDKTKAASDTKPDLRVERGEGACDDIESPESPGS